MNFPVTGSQSTGSREAQDDWTPQQSIPLELRLHSLRKQGIDEVRLDCGPVDAHRVALISIGMAFLGLLGSIASGTMSIAAVAVAILAIAIWTRGSQANRRWRIYVRPGDLMVEQMIWWRLSPRVLRFPIATIECISLAPQTSRRSAIVIETTSSTTPICAGLSERSLVWLKNYLIMEIACLTWRPISKNAGKGNGPIAAGSNPIMLRPELAVRLTRIFLEQAPKELEQLRAAVNLGEATDISRHAHWLKSASANVGAHRLSELCQLLEMNARDGDLAHCPLLCREVEMMLPGIVGWLRGIEENASEMLVAGPRDPNGTAKREEPASAERLPIEARVLVADDSSVSREIAHEYLSELVTTVEFAVDGGQAIDMWRNGNFDLIFMDCEMIPIDGFEAVRRIRQEECVRGVLRTPIVALTGHVLQQHRERCIAVGMDDYIGKPYPPEMLERAIDRWIGQRVLTASCRDLAQRHHAKDDSSLVS
jgi:CheY-like chemotaxis protein